MMFRRSIPLIWLAFSSLSALASEGFALKGSVHEPVPFKSNRGYLAMNVAAMPLRGLLQNVAAEENVKLINRGEAHITVLTPSEFSAVSAVLGADGIEQIAEQRGIQNSAFETICVGKGVVGRNSTYFVVVKAAALVELRQAILDAYKEQAGKKANFSAEHYYPHITLGFTKADLHEEQGVVKDESSCIAPVAEE